MKYIAAVTGADQVRIVGSSAYDGRIENLDGEGVLHFKFFRQMPVPRMVVRGNGIGGCACFGVCKYLNAIAGRRSNAVGKTAFKIKQYPASLEQEETANSNMDAPFFKSPVAG